MATTEEALIGILAGMGPKSTAPFVDAVVHQSQSVYGAQNDDEFPPMMIYSLPTPFYMDRPLDHGRMEAIIIKGLRKLESTGAAFIAMPCNSAHVYFDRLQPAIKVPLLNIIEETLHALPKNPTRLTLLSTPMTFESGIYQKGFEKAGHEWVFQGDWQADINRLLESIKAGKPGAELLNQWEDLAGKIRMEAVAWAVIACTDLNVVAHGDAGIALIDSSACLAKAVVREYLAAKTMREET